MILKLNLYFDLDYKGDPSLVPLIKAGLEDHLKYGFEDTLKGTEDEQFIYSFLFPSEFHESEEFLKQNEKLLETGVKGKVLSHPEVQLLQTRLLRDQQNRLNMKKQKESSTQKSGQEIKSKRKTTKK
jgi:hypothetical protein